MDIDDTTVLLTENSCSHGDIYAPNDTRTPNDTIFPIASTTRTTHAYEKGALALFCFSIVVVIPLIIIVKLDP